MTEIPTRRPSFLVATALALAFAASGQLGIAKKGGLFDRIRRNVEEKVEKKVEETVDEVIGTEAEGEDTPTQSEPNQADPKPSPSSSTDSTSEPTPVFSEALSVTTTTVGDPADIDSRVDLKNRWRVNVSERGMHVGYVAKRGSRSVVVIDGESGPEFDEILETYPPQFMPGPAHLGLRGRETFVAVLFTPNGDHFALVEIEKGSGGHVLVNGQPSGPRISVHGGPSDFLVLDPTGRIGFIGQLQEDNSQVVVVDGEVKHAAEFRCPVRYRHLTLSRTGEGYAVVKVEDGGSYAVIDGEITGFDYDGIQNLAFSADGKSVGYVAKKDRISYVVVDDEEQDGVKSVLRFAFASRDNRWAFTGQGTDRSYVLVADGEAIDLPEKSKPIDFAFSPDGRHLAYLNQVGSKMTVFLDGEPTHKDVPHIRVLNTEEYVENNRKETAPCYFALSPDASRVLYSTFAGFMVNGSPVTEGEVYNPVVSENLRHFAGLDAGMGNDARLVLDGRKSDAQFGRPEKLETRRLHIADDGTVTALVETDRGLERLTARP